MESIGSGRIEVNVRNRSGRLNTVFFASLTVGALACQAGDDARDSDPGLPSPDGAFDDPNSPGDDRPSNDPRPPSDGDDGRNDGDDDDRDEPAGASCCDAHGSPGCEDTMVQTEVCDVVSHCCASEWDARCVEEAETVGACGDTSTTGAGGTSGGSSGDGNASAEHGMGDNACMSDSDCLAGQTCNGDTCIVDNASNGCCVESTEPGCNSDSTMACVCAMDPFCCESAWDGSCVDSVGSCAAPCP